MQSLKGLQIIMEPIKFVKVSHRLKMDIVVSVNLTVRIHDDKFFERRFKNALKLFVTLNRLSRLSKFILEYQSLGRL
jgi:hypothetical protein